MPTAPLGRCTYPGCTTRARGRCPAHRDPRPSSARRGYGGRWRSVVRPVVLAARPYCEAPGCDRAATDVDHIVALRQGGTDDPDNLRALCHAHHSTRTARDQPGGWNMR